MLGLSHLHSLNIGMFSIVCMCCTCFEACTGFLDALAFRPLLNVFLSSVVLIFVLYTLSWTVFLLFHHQ